MGTKKNSDDVENIRKIAREVMHQNGNKDYTNKEILYYLTKTMDDVKSNINQLHLKMDTHVECYNDVNSRVSNIEGRLKIFVLGISLGVPILVTLMMFILKYIM